MAIYALFAALWALPALAEEGAKVSTIPAPPTEKAAPAPKKVELPDFKAIGSKEGEVETGFEKQHGPKEGQIEKEKKPDGVQLPKELEGIVDQAGKVLKTIDNSALKTVSPAFDLLGLEAEKARFKPMHGGVGLGISINLDKDKKKAPQETSGDASPDQEPEKKPEKDSQRVYDIFKPQD